MINISFKFCQGLAEVQAAGNGEKGGSGTGEDDSGQEVEPVVPDGQVSLLDIQG